MASRLSEYRALLLAAPKRRTENLLDGASSGGRKDRLPRRTAQPAADRRSAPEGVLGVGRSRHNVQLGSVLAGVDGLLRSVGDVVPPPRLQAAVQPSDPTHDWDRFRAPLVVCAGSRRGDGWVPGDPVAREVALRPKDTSGIDGRLQAGFACVVWKRLDSGPRSFHVCVEVPVYNHACWISETPLGPFVCGSRVKPALTCS